MGGSLSTYGKEALLDFDGRDGLLYCNGKQFSIKGVNWFGSEAYNGPPGGLDVHSVEWYMECVAARSERGLLAIFF